MPLEEIADCKCLLLLIYLTDPLNPAVWQYTGVYNNEAFNGSRKITLIIP